MPVNVRSDFALQLQLQHVAERAVAPRVKDTLVAVFKHMAGGRSGHRRGGRTLITLLEKVRSTAATADEWQVVRLVQDSLDYAEGRILRPDFEERYQLFQRSTAPLSSHQDYLARTLSASLNFFAQLANDYLDQHPEANPSEVLAHVDSVGRDARYMQQSQERPGRYRILRGSAEVAAWLEQVFHERVDGVCCTIG